MPDSAQLRFRASSYSNGGNGCVEPAPHTGGVTVRDSKDPEGPRIEFTHRQWARFLREAADDLPCGNGAVTISHEQQDRVFHGEPKRICWSLHAVSTPVILWFTAAEKDAFLRGAAASEFTFPETAEALAGSAA